MFKKIIKKRKKWFLAMGGCGLTLIIGCLFVAYFLPLPKQFLEPQQIATTKILDRHGELLYEILNPKEGKKTLIPLNKIPKSLINATLTVEDVNFFKHGGVDPKAILRAIYLNFSQGRIVSGGSTLTQQLVRNMLGVQLKRNYRNKLLETIYAIRLNTIYSKEKILELYLNKIYYGNLAYGVESAALDYFDKHVYDLDLAETALIAGLPQSPSNYNPFSNFQASKKRQAYVLDLMVKNKFASKEEAEAAKSEPLKFRKNKFQIKAPHFTHYIISRLEDKYGEEMTHFGGLKVYTTLDENWQLKAERLLAWQVESLGKSKVGNGAILSLDPKTNQVLVWAGSKDYFDENIDGAVDMLLSLRQPGSALKPFNYLAAFLKGYTPATTVTDIYAQFETETGPYTPKNYDLKFHGLVRLRNALASSLNIPAVKVLDFVTVPYLINFLEKFGIDTFMEPPEHYGLALTLGGGEVRMKNLAEAYSTLANMGEKRDLSFILKITDHNGEILEQWKLPEAQNILPKNGKEAAYQVIDILSDNNARLMGFGAGSPLELSRRAAVKTGTTRNFKDNWTVGFTPNLLILVWMGNADGTPMENVSGVTGAGPLWHVFMEEVLRTLPMENFKKPENLIEKEICAISGKLPTELCQEKVREIFIKGTEPMEEDSLWQKVKGTCEQATSAHATGENFICDKEKIMIVYPPELRRWAWGEGIWQPEISNNEFLISNEIPNSKSQIPNKTQSSNVQNLKQEEVIIEIASPIENDSFEDDPTLPNEFEKIPLRVNAAQEVKTVIWYVDNIKAAEMNEFPFTYLWPLKEGWHTAQAAGILSEGKEVKSGEVRFEVVE